MKELMAKIGKQAIYVTDNGLPVPVKVLDVKMSYGKVRYLITPWFGKISGVKTAKEVWVEQLSFEK